MRAGRRWQRRRRRSSLSAVSDGFTQISDEIESAISDPSLDAAAKQMRLRSISSRLQSLLGRASSYRGDQALVQEAQAGDHARTVLAMRANADAHDHLVAEGHLPEDLKAQGFVTHADLDKLDEEGLLSEAAASWPWAAEVDEEAPAE